jgi:hypothetical protein
MIAQKIVVSYGITRTKDGVTVAPHLSLEVVLQQNENRTACLEQTMTYMRELVNNEASRALASITEDD